jgi:hypothetical protein
MTAQHGGLSEHAKRHPANTYAAGRLGWRDPCNETLEARRMKATPLFHFIHEARRTPEKRARVATVLRSYREQPETFRFVFREIGRYMVEHRSSGVIAVFETRAP